MGLMPTANPLPPLKYLIFYFLSEEWSFLLYPLEIFLKGGFKEAITGIPQKHSLGSSQKISSAVMGGVCGMTHILHETYERNFMSLLLQLTPKLIMKSI